jgi:hypothetical protein
MILIPLHHFIIAKPLKIRVRLGPQPPIVCRKKRLNGLISLHHFIIIKPVRIWVRIDSQHILVCRKRTEWVLLIPSEL